MSVRPSVTMTDRATPWLPSPEPGGPVSCGTCGCRLEPLEGAPVGSWRHFRSDLAGQDARGCRTRCVDLVHDSAGRWLEEPPLA